MAKSKSLSIVEYDYQQKQTKANRMVKFKSVSIIDTDDRDKMLKSSSLEGINGDNGWKRGSLMVKPKSLSSFKYNSRRKGGRQNMMVKKSKPRSKSLSLREYESGRKRYSMVRSKSVGIMKHGSRRRKQDEGKQLTKKDMQVLFNHKLGAGIAGGTVGLLLGGPIAAAIAGFGTVYYTNKEGVCGDFARAMGDVAFVARDRAYEVDEKHRIVDGSVKVANQAANQVVDGSVKAANHIADGSKKAAYQVVDGSKKAASQIADGSKIVADQIVRNSKRASFYLDDGKKAAMKTWKTAMSKKRLSGIYPPFAALAVGQSLSDDESEVTHSLSDEDKSYYQEEGKTEHGELKTDQKLKQPEENEVREQNPSNLKIDEIKEKESNQEQGEIKQEEDSLRESDEINDSESSAEASSPDTKLTSTANCVTPRSDVETFTGNTGWELFFLGPSLSVASATPDRILAAEKKEEPSTMEKEEEEEPLEMEKKEESLEMEKKEESLDVEKKEAPVAVEKKEAPVAVEKKEAPVAVEKKEAPVAVGKKEAPASVGKKEEPAFVGKKEEPVAVGKKEKEEPVAVGKEEKEEPVALETEEKEEPVALETKEKEEPVAAEKKGESPSIKKKGKSPALKGNGESLAPEIKAIEKNMELAAIAEIAELVCVGAEEVYSEDGQSVNSTEVSIPQSNAIVATSTGSDVVGHTDNAELELFFLSPLLSKADSGDSTYSTTHAYAKIVESTEETTEETTDESRQHEEKITLQKDQSRQHKPYEQSEEAMQLYDATQNARGVGAGIIGGVVGLCVVGPVVALLSGFVALYLSDTKGVAGDIARAIGDVALAAREKAGKVNMKHRVITKKTINRAWSRTRRLSRRVLQSTSGYFWQVSDSNNIDRAEMLQVLRGNYGGKRNLSLDNH